jgi:peptide chain release factor 3
MNAPVPNAQLADAISRRRTFAIISHPDAGKTTLTEKLLLFGGAIQLAGQVRAKRNAQQTRSDWMSIERERGISVVTSVMTFEYGGCVFNLLDTPGHEDFSEDTYRTLSAVDAAVMVIDAAKGIEARTRKLFEVCRLRDIPIVTFINKLDREARDPFELLDEIEKTLALDATPITWPISRGKTFAGTYRFATKSVRKLDKDDEQMVVSGLGDPALIALLPPFEAEGWQEEAMLAEEGSKPFDLEAFREGHLTPVFFGSALRNFGVRDLIDAMAEYAPSPRGQEADKRKVEATEPKMTGFVFKIQANMDPNHRDRIAFMRVCSGKMTRGMKVKLARTGKTLAINAPQFFFARDRSIADEAYAGDVVGLPNHGALRIGDTLTEGEDLVFRGVPSFAPEILRRLTIGDAMKAKKLKEALRQLAEEGVVQLFTPQDGSGAIVGVVGALQLDVLATRLQAEYGLDTKYEMSRFTLCRWVTSEDKTMLRTFLDSNRSSIALDIDDDPVFMAPSAYSLNYDAERNKAIQFSDVKDYQKGAGKG